MPKLIAQGVYKHKDDEFEFALPILLFPDGDSIIAYCPVLDLSGYGLDETSAKGSFRIVLEEFVKYTLENNTFESELKRLGWKVKVENSRLRKVEMPDMFSAIRKNPTLHLLLQHGTFKKYDESISIPVH